MKAGRELDALVAEKVMGIVRDPSRCERCGWPLRNTIDEGCVQGNCSMRPVPDISAPRPYSSDIAAAWEVVEKLRASGMPVIIHAWHHGPWCKVTVCEPSHEHEVTGESVPECICLAALKAVGVEVKA